MTVVRLMMLKIVAIDNRHRGQGEPDEVGPVARQVMTETLARMEERAETATVSPLIVEAHIDARNRSSQRLFKEMGFRMQRMFDETYQQWIYTYDF